MLPNSKQNIVSTSARQNIDAAKKASQAESQRKQAIEDALEKEKRRKGGGGGGGAPVVRGGGVRYGGAEEIQSSFIAQNYRAGERADATKQIMQANTYADNGATAKAS